MAFAVAATSVHAQVANFRSPGLKPTAATLEEGLWGLADKAEVYVKGSGELDRDPALNAFARQVACRVAPEYCADLRVYVMDRPPFNATAAPNGLLEMNSGFMLRAQTEDEFAYVIGHEITHFARNHTLARFDQQRNTANVLLALQVGVTIGAGAAMYSAAASGAPNATSTIRSISDTAQALNNLIYLQGMASFFSFNREQESEADALGFDRAVAAGYSPDAGASIWKTVVAETKASDFPKVQKSLARASIFDTHPLSDDRIEALTKRAKGAVGTSDLEARKRYRAVIRAHLGPWLKDDLRRRDYGQTLYVISRLEEIGEDLGVLGYYRGEALRLRRGAGDEVAALSAFRASTEHADAPPEAWRALGEALQKTNAPAEAATAFERYLAVASDADDRWIVEANLKSLRSRTQ